jgi:mRNA-degrading endonuclease RelE of RelBE toxin-antitoxin system
MVCARTIISISKVKIKKDNIFFQGLFFFVIRNIHEKLSGAKSVYRIRVGVYRIVYEIADKSFAVVCYRRCSSQTGLSLIVSLYTKNKNFISTLEL